MLRHAIAIDLGWPTMSDPLTWSPISLGRWFGTAVRVHLILIIYVASWLLVSAVHFAAEGGAPTAFPDDLLVGAAADFPGHSRAGPCGDGGLA